MQLHLTIEHDDQIKTNSTAGQTQPERLSIEISEVDGLNNLNKLYPNKSAVPDRAHAMSS